MKLISIGFGNAVAAARILAVVSPDSRTHQARRAGGAGTRHAARCLIRP